MLSIGAALLGSCHVIGIDIDGDAISTAQSNIDDFEDLQVEVPGSCWTNVLSYDEQNYLR